MEPWYPSQTKKFNPLPSGYLHPAIRLKINQKTGESRGVPKVLLNQKTGESRGVPKVRWYLTKLRRTSLFSGLSYFFHHSQPGIFVIAWHLAAVVLVKRCIQIFDME